MLYDFTVKRIRPMVFGPSFHPEKVEKQLLKMGK
jgi:hypothetical protein